VPAATPLADRSSMVYAGTGVTRGRGRALVCSTGEATELGLISQLAAEAKPPPTPLQRRLGRLAREMVLLGTALTLQTSLGFLLTTATIQVIPPVVRGAGWPWAFALLAVGPFLGILAIRRLVARDARR